MSPVYSARKRADEFDALVSGAADAAAAGRHAELLDLVGALRSVAPVQARPEFVSSLRTQLMAAAATELSPVEVSLAERLTVPQRRTARDRRLAAAIGGLAIVGATTSMAVAAQSALPGDVLYPLKRVIENAHTTVSLGQDHKGSTLLHNVAGRLQEVDALARTGDADPDTIAQTLADFAAQASQASDLLLADFGADGDQSSVLELRAFAARSLGLLDQLASEIPAGARSALIQAANVLAGIDAAAHRACPTCDGAGIDRFPQWMLRAADEVDPLVRSDSIDSGASVTRVGGKGRRHEPATTPTPSPIIDPGALDPSSGSSGGSTPSPSSDDALTQLGDALLGNGGTSGSHTGASNGSDDDLLTGVLDDVSTLLDPDGDGTLGGQPAKGSSGK